MWDFLTTPENANAIMAITAVLALFGGFITWFFGLWGNRKTKPTKAAKSGGVIVEGNVHGDITTNPPSKKGGKKNDRRKASCGW